MYKIETNYLEHDGGSKFYETVLITRDDGVRMLTKRYGAIAHKRGGGTTLLEFEGGRAVKTGGVILSRDKILREKRTERVGKGRYMDALRPNVGLHNSEGKAVDDAAFSYGVSVHYSKADCSEIRNYFKLAERALAESDRIESVIETVLEVPVIRDATWGSW